ncbi:MAG TPA: DinB family protein [Pirellulales bacterium]
MADRVEFACEIDDSVPTTRDTLLVALEKTHRDVTGLWQRLGADEFFTLPADRGWSPAGNLVHLVGALTPVTMALKLPRFVPWLLFGRPSKPSRAFVELRDAYLGKLGQGATAGRFAAQRRPPPANPIAARDALVARWQPAVPKLCAALRRWDDAALDRYRLPHPILGKLSVREMLYFTVYHLRHHAEIVAARFPRAN